MSAINTLFFYILRIIYIDQQSNVFTIDVFFKIYKLNNYSLQDVQTTLLEIVSGIEKDTIPSGIKHI